LLKIVETRQQLADVRAAGRAAGGHRAMSRLDGRDFFLPLLWDGTGDGNRTTTSSLVKRR
jgi:hypothetical protein